ncbi:MAG: phospholipase D-like domain-containing protein [bacterium]|nr:phospholipase D-like domain-containing protein [bacterium]
MFSKVRGGAAPQTAALLLVAITISGCSSRMLRVDSTIAVAHPAFPATVAGIAGRKFSENNAVEFLSTGAATFERLFEMIRTARHSINLELYIYNTDETGDRLADLLIERAQAGVRVNLLIDAVGGFYFEDETAERLEAGGVKVYLYNRWNYFDMWHYRIRTHRRVVVVDGRRGMVGGFAITDWWHEPYQFFKYPVFDLQAYVEGDVVAQLQSVFLENWKQVSDEVLTGPEYFPATNSQQEATRAAESSEPRSTDARRNIFAMTSGSSPPREVPHESTSSIYENYLFAIRSARENIRIFTPFFVPDQALTDELIAASKRGVDVRIVIPDEKYILEAPAYYAGHNYYEELLEGGVRMFHFQIGLLHSKGAVFDELYGLVGSTNFDQRSFKIDYENDLHIYDAGLARELDGMYRFYEQNSAELTLDKFRARGLWPRSQECLWRPIEHEF